MTDPQARLPAALADRYRLERELGQGGMATVYLAEDIRHRRRVALKVLRPELAAVIGAERFLKEIETTANLQHPHILPLFDSGTVHGSVFYVMPFVEGESLRDRLAREKQLPVADAVRIATEVAGALDYAHRKGIVHRDIKPENILLQDGRALVADFGIALAASATAGTRMTETGMSLGTPHYMSPEQAMGEREITARADIYALGAMTYEMLSGEPPFTGPTAQAIVAKVMTEKPASLVARRDRIPPAVEEAVLTALEKLPADRFASAAEFATALRTDGHPDRRTLGTGRAAARRPAQWAVLPGALLLAALLAAWGWLRPVPVPAPEVSRYRVTVDSIADLRDWMGALAISPDGRAIVHTSGEAGPLLRRQRDALGFTPMPGTAGARGPFFSPDGAMVGFVSGRQLLLAPIGGGPPVVFASLARPGSFAWGDDGYLYGDGSLGGQLERAPARPGAPWEPFTTVDSAAGETGHRLPEPLPDGQGVLFQAQYRDGRVMLAVANPKTGRHRTLFAGARARYVPGGHLVFSTGDDKLWSVPFDARSLEVLGSPVQLASGLPRTMVGPVDFDVSRTGTLVYAEGDQRAHRELVWVARNGARTPVDTTWRAAFVGPRLSPDGTRMAVTIADAAASHIWIKPLPAGRPRRFSQGSAAHDEPAWTPDGRALSFIAAGGGGTAVIGAVYRRAPDSGAGDELLLTMDRTTSEQSWSWSGGWLVVRTTTPTAGQGDVLAIRPGVDREPVPVLDSPSSEYSPAVSPDGRWLAYVSNESGRLEVYVVPFPVPGGQKWQISTDGGMAPAWSPRGGELFYLDLRANMIAVSVETTPGFAPREARTLFDAADLTTRSVSRRNYDVSPDGERFLMVRRAAGIQNVQLVVVEHWAEELRGQSR